MGEPKNKKSKEWREWKVRHLLGATVVETIKNTSVKDLEVIESFVHDAWIDRVDSERTLMCIDKIHSCKPTGGPECAGCGG